MPRINYVSVNGANGEAQDVSQQTAQASDYGYVEIGSDDLNDPGSFPFRVDQYGNVSGSQVFSAGRSQQLQAWSAALAGRNSASTVVACVGDSFTSGNNPGITEWEQSWPAQLQARLNDRFPSPAATGQGRGLLPPEYPGTDLTLDYVAVTGTPFADTGFGFNNFSYSIDAGGGCTLTYSLDGDSAVIAYYTQANGGSFTYTLDSGDPVTVSTDGGFSGAAIEFVSLGSAGAHTLVIEYVASSGSCWISGVIEFNGDGSAGLQVYNCGAGGTTTASWAGYDWSPFTGATLGLLILELMGNDWETNVDPATAKANLQAIITQARGTLGATLPVLLLIPPPQDAETTYPWQAYINAMGEIAATAGSCDVLDLSLRMPVPDGAGGPYGLYNANGELSANGHAMVADLVCEYLSPQ